MCIMTLCNQSHNDLDSLRGQCIGIYKKILIEFLLDCADYLYVITQRS